MSISLSSFVLAQPFTHCYKLNTVAKEAWYKLLLTPAMRANANPDLSDLRLFEQGDSTKEIPYFLNEEYNPKEDIYFKPFKWNPKIKTNRGLYLIEQPNPDINELVLKISNHKDARVFNLQGSMDGKNWFAISDQDYLVPDHGSKSTFYWHSLSFPKVKYPFLQLHFTDSLNEIQILDIGEMVHTKPGSIWSQVNQIEYTVKNLPEEKKTLIKIFASRPQWFDQFSLRILDPPYFLRAAKLYTKYFVTPKKGPRREIKSDLFSFEMKAGQANSFSFKHLLKDTLYLEIFNLDNAPLVLNDISFFQKPVYLYTYLKAGESIQLSLGQPKLLMPNYDLKPFAPDVNTGTVKELKVMEVKAMEPSIPIKKEISFWQSEAFMWLCIGVGAIVVFLISYRLIDEMKSEN